MKDPILASAAVSLIVLPSIGGRVHRLRAFGHDLLRSPADPADHDRQPFFWGAHQMAPWCNRIASRPTEVAGAIVDLPANFADGSAIHGQVYARPWNTASHSDGSYELSIDAGGDGWPWPYAAAIRYRVRGNEVLIEQSLTNHGATPMPAGIGIHPWFVTPVDVEINAGSVYGTNSGSPAKPQAVDGRFDRRSLGQLPLGLDATWADLGEPAVRLSWPTLGVSATMAIRSSSTQDFIVAASPTDIDAVAVEPQTHGPDGLRRLLNEEPGALSMLEPGEALGIETRLTFETEGG